MKTLEIHGVKIYELSGDPVVPKYLKRRTQQKLKNKQRLLSSNFEVIHDLSMPDFCANITLTPDEKYVFVLGGYKPRLRCYDLDQLSMKFERYCDEIPQRIAYLSDDYSRFALLEGERTVSVHGPGGVHGKLALRQVGRDVLYCHLSNHLCVPLDNGSMSVYDINNGKLEYDVGPADRAPLNCAALNPFCDLILTGHSDGTVGVFNPRAKRPIAQIDAKTGAAPEGMRQSYVPEVRQLAVKDSVTFAVGTDKGMCHLFDIRDWSRPASSHNLFYPSPVKKILFHEDKVIAAVQSIIKVWEPVRADERPGDSDDALFAYYDTRADINDVLQFPGSGLFLVAADRPGVRSYFIPRLGDAPSWCSRLSNLILEAETECKSMYNTHEFVTREEVEEYRLAHLIGTASLRAYMHGFHISGETLRQARNAAVRRKAEEERLRNNPVASIRPTGEEAPADKDDEIADPPINAALKSLYGDRRFADLFSNDKFLLDPNHRLYKQAELDMRRVDKKRRKKSLLQMKAKKSQQIADHCSDSERDDDNSE